MNAAVDQIATTTPTLTKEEAAALAREKGWTEPEKYDYEKYAQPPPRDAEPAPEAMIWGARAAKYEWKDEYGEIGPPNEELEKMLFHGEHINRAGDDFEQYVSFLTVSPVPSE
jgi:ATP-dependent RNA helicase DDX3X